MQKQNFEKYRVLGDKLRKYLNVIQILLIVGWMILLWNVEGRLYPQVYNLCGIFSLVCIYLNDCRVQIEEHRNKAVLLFTALLFSAAVYLANYPIFEPLRSINGISTSLLCLLGGVSVFYQILSWAMKKIPITGQTRERIHPCRFFTLCFVLSCTVYLIYLLTVAYPGYYTLDTLNAFDDIIRGEYQRRIPVYYTLFIELCINIGYFFGGTGNSALVIYTIIQSVCMAAVCAYALVTLYEINASKLGIWLTFFAYTFFPYNLVYSSTIWKDIPFGIGMLAISVALYRVSEKIGNEKANYVSFLLGSFVFCLSRTNGWYSFVGIVLLIGVLLRNQGKKLVTAGIVIILVTWTMLNPLLSLISSKEADYIELMGIPFQQVARVVYNGHKLPEEEVQLLEQVFDYDSIGELYNPESVDGIKYQCFDRSKYDYFMENLDQYASLWIRIGFRYPSEYLKAWIDQTKGYWNAGYRYWIYVNDGEFAPLGFTRESRNNYGAMAFDQFFTWLEGSELYQKVACSIGLNVWILLGCMVINLLKKRKAFLIGVPSCVILIGLWLFTPVFAEFRYAWPIMLTAPFMLCATVFQKDDAQEPGVLA